MGGREGGKGLDLTGSGVEIEKLSNFTSIKFPIKSSYPTQLL